jgi:hypothetical protein
MNDLSKVCHGQLIDEQQIWKTSTWIPWLWCSTPVPCTTVLGYYWSSTQYSCRPGGLVNMAYFTRTSVFINYDCLIFYRVLVKKLFYPKRLSTAGTPNFGDMHAGFNQSSCFSVYMIKYDPVTLLRFGNLFSRFILQQSENKKSWINPSCFQLGSTWLSCQTLWAKWLGDILP